MPVKPNRKRLGRIALDCEASGLDIFHAAEPYFVTIAFEEGTTKHWRWHIDPETRKVQFRTEDFAEIRQHIADADEIVGQHIKYDVAALTNSGVIESWPWEKTHDLLIGAHLLASNMPKSLDALAVEFLLTDITPLEDRMKAACHKARAYCRSHLPDWLIAREGLPGMPSIKSGDKKKAKKRGDDIESPWKADTWLPAQLARHLGFPEPAPGCTHRGPRREVMWGDDWICRLCGGHAWYWLTEDYANMDSAATLAIWPRMWSRIEAKGLQKVYAHRRQLPRLAYLLQVNGPYLYAPKRAELKERFKAYLDEASKECLEIAHRHKVNYCYSCLRLTGTPRDEFDKRCECGRGNKRTPDPRVGPYPLELPTGNVNDSLKSFAFNVLNLEHVQNPKAKTAAPSLDAKNAIPHYMVTLDKDSNQYKFVAAYADRNTFTTAISYLDAYERFWLPAGVTNGRGEHLYYRLYPWLNPTATDHIRWSCKAPNVQNISKGATECRRCHGDGCSRCGYTGKGKVSLREAFCAPPWGELWTFDAKNIERRIPAYEANETAIIELLEQPDKGPYYGSEHALVGHIIWKQYFELCVDAKGNLDGRLFKKRYADTYYQWTKNFNFCIQYGGQRATADKSAHRDGAFELVKERFAGQTALNDYWVNFAKKNGYVETMAHRDIDPARGYPIQVPRDSRGNVEPTKPLNYHSSGTAMVWTNEASLRVQGVLDEWNKRAGRQDYFMMMQVHDELGIVMPRRADPRVNRIKSNLGRAREIQRIMASVGDGFGIPTPVSAEYCPVSWAEGTTF